MKYGLLFFALFLCNHITKGQDSLTLNFHDDEVTSVNLFDTVNFYKMFKADSMSLNGYRLKVSEKITEIFQGSALLNSDSTQLFALLGRPSFRIDNGIDIYFCYYILPKRYDAKKYDFRLFIRFYYNKKIGRVYTVKKVC